MLTPTTAAWRKNARFESLIEELMGKFGKRSKRDLENIKKEVLKRFENLETNSKELEAKVKDSEQKIFITRIGTRAMMESPELEGEHHRQRRLKQKEAEKKKKKR